MKGSYSDNPWNLSWVIKEVRTKGRSGQRKVWGRSMNYWDGGVLGEAGRDTLDIRKLDDGKKNLEVINNDKI